MKHAKLIVGLSAAATVALLLAGGWYMSERFATAKAKRNARDSEFAKLRQLYGSKPFPNADNALRARQDTAALEGMRMELTNALGSANLPLPQLSRSLFIQALQSSLRDKLQGAAPIVEGRRVVPDNFGFGFERYRGEGAMPAEGAVARLAQQLIIVERLVDEIYASKVSELRAIRRPVFEELTGDGVSPAPAADDGRRRRDRRAPDTQAAASQQGLRSTDLYTAQHFTIEVSGHQAAISELLNRLAAMEMFVVVTEVELRKRADDIKPPPAPVTAAAPATPATTLAAPVAPAAPATPAAAAAPDTPAVSTLPPSQRLMSGPEIDPPLDARIELDVFNFNTKEA